jgi:D-amino peptidase
MRVVIFCDMEGVAGISVWEQVTGGSPLYDEGRRLYTAEVNAAVRGCKRAGASEIVVIDGHGAGGAWSFKSLIPEQLESGAQYVQGHTWLRYLRPLEEGCDASLLVGAHAMAGTADGVLSHTVSGPAWYEARINGTPIGEPGMMAAMCGDFDCPCVFISGDLAACEELKALVGESVVEAQVKVGLGRYAARHLPSVDACALIEGRVYGALARRDWPAPLKLPTPVTLSVQFFSPDRVNEFLGRPGVVRAGPRTLEVRAATFRDVWDQFWHR